MPTAVIYARISQDRTGAGLGVARQEQDARALAERLGLTVVTVLSDNDLSAYNRRKKRPDYQELLRGLAERRWDVLITWHTDRLHRNNAELETFINVVEASGVTVHTVTAGTLDLTTPSGRMVARILGAQAQYEAEQKAERQKGQMRQAAEMGKFHGGRRPFGWGAPVAADAGDVVLIDRSRPNPAEAALIREAVADVLTQGATWTSVAKRWNEAGVLTATGKPWHGTKVMQALTALRHAGLTIIERGSGPAGAGTVYGRAPHAIITPEEHHALVAVTRAPGRRTKLEGGRVHLLSGLAVCGAAGCGAPIKGSGRDRAGFLVYRCSGWRPGIPQRGHVHRRCDDVNQIVEKMIVGRLARPDAVVLLEPDDGPARVAAVQARQVRERRKKAAARWALGELDDDEFDAMKAELDPLLADLERRAAPPPAARLFDGLVGLGSVVATRAAWDACVLDRQRAVVDGLLRVEVLPTGRWGVVPGGSGPAMWLAAAWKR